MRDFWELPPEEELVYSGPDWLLLVLDRYDDLMGANLLLLIWRCWNVRNGVLMAGESVSVGGSVNFLLRYSDTLLQTRQQVTSPVSRHGRKSRTGRRWCRPVNTTPKINVDGAFVAETGAAALVVVIRDTGGLPLLMACRTLAHCHDATESEALACLEGIRMGAVWPDREFVLETDCA
ncbi:hypothetical protein HU200_049465 [Digitaria exilis]|uniref:RNase H type-1 domain-containing protein n=1 Tax=Digitaria exilis TaxID=1010633 RepID=A0A835AST5_9POAL|nr:hypothetical protein HU200_049465 [Digitaria exilis]